MAGPGPLELVEAICTVLRTKPSLGTVVPDPDYYDDEATYPAMLTTGGPESVQGVLVGVLGEDPEIQSSPDGGEQFTRFFVTIMLSVAVDATGCPSRLAMNTMVKDAKAALRGSPNLGLTVTGGDVRHERLYGPQGYFPRTFKEFRVHVAPMELRVFVRWC